MKKTISRCFYDYLLLFESIHDSTSSSGTNSFFVCLIFQNIDFSTFYLIKSSEKVKQFLKLKQKS